MEMASAKFIRQLNDAADGAYGPTSRERVAAVFRACARGVDAQTADARTKAFYRASRFDWALALG